MRPVDSSNPLLAQIRAQAIAWKRKTPVQEPATPSDEPPETRPRAPEDWLAQVAQAVVAISRDDPQRRRKAFRAYLQALLARECGVERVEDRAFAELVDRVLETMEADAKLRKAMQSAGDLLLQSAAG